MNVQPTNAKTGNEYTNTNVLKLICAGYEDNTWATYRQWLQLGFQVQKGQKGTRLQKIVVVNEKRSGKEKRVPRTFSVFNVSQVVEIEIEVAS
tara:strand:+ start:170 stop:448 length:279 start_codon:yes stop_codon:yes gene_type:complete